MKDKSPEVLMFMNAMTMFATGRTLVDCISHGFCTVCGGRVEGFKDALSEGEYKLSGLCQECQDKCFAEPEE